MAINFEKKTPDWENIGAEPDAELKKGGFRAGYKPPAAYFNWFFNRISACVKELQEKLTANLKALAFKDKVGNGDITDVAAGKVTQDSTHRMITDTERINWNDANSKKHTHSNKSTIDKLTETLLANWTTAYTHVSNKSNPHGVTKAQVGLGNVPNAATNDQTPTYTQASSLTNLTSGEKLSESFGKIMKAIAELITHKADVVTHITSGERIKWNAVTNKVDKVSGKQLSTNDFTTVEKNKLSGIADGANNYTHPSTHPANMIMQDTTHRYVTDSEKNTWNGKAAGNHTHSSLVCTDITGKTVDVNTYNMSGGSPSIQWYVEKTSGGAANISNIPVAGQPFMLKAELIRWSSASDYMSKQTFISATAKATYERYCTNGTWSGWLPEGRFSAIPVSGRVLVSDGDTGGIKASAYTIGTSVPANAKFTDTTYGVVTQSASGLMASADKVKLDGVAESANKYVHPSNHTASMITQDSAHRFVSDTEKNTWNGKVSAAGGDIADTKVSTFTASTASYPVPVAGDTVKIGFGKIKKFSEDIKNWMTGVCLIGQIVNNCVTNRADLPLSAAQGKALMDLYNALNARFGHIGDYYITNSSSNFTLPGISSSAKLALSLWVPAGKYIVIFEAGCSSGISEVFISSVMAFWNTTNYVNSGTGFLNATTDTTIQVLLKGNGTISSGQMRIKAIRIQ